MEGDEADAVLEDMPLEAVIFAGEELKCDIVDLDAERSVYEGRLLCT